VKRLFLVRHAEPKPGHPLDGTRPLTAAGRTQANEVAGWLKGFVGRVDIAISSPMTRALQTAEIIAASLGCHVAATTMVQPDVKPADMWDDIVRLAAMATDVLVVSHEPALANLVGWLSGWRAEEGAESANPLMPEYPGIRFEWGAVAHLKITGEKQARLQWLVIPAIVEKDEAIAEIEEAARALVAAI
jgi:phosphohistidine phosphatase